MMVFQQPEGSTAVLSYMVPHSPQTHITEDYVSSPPGLIIVDERGAYWTLGLQYQWLRDAPEGEFAFNVLRNGRETGVFASRIERRKGKIRVLQRGGTYLYWNGQSFA